MKKVLSFIVVTVMLAVTILGNLSGIISAAVIDKRGYPFANNKMIPVYDYSSYGTDTNTIQGTLGSSVKFADSEMHVFQTESGKTARFYQQTPTPDENMGMYITVRNPNSVDVILGFMPYLGSSTLPKGVEGSKYYLINGDKYEEFEYGTDMNYTTITIPAYFSGKLVVKFDSYLKGKNTFEAADVDGFWVVLYDVPEDEKQHMIFDDFGFIGGRKGSGEFEEEIVDKDDFLFSTYYGKNYLIGYSGDKRQFSLPESYNGESYEIYKYAFFGCYGLTSISIPDSVTSIGNYAFYGCTGLTSVTIGNGVTSIGSSVFSGCGGLTSITVTGGNTKYHSADNCIIETETKTLILGCKKSVIPDDCSVMSIGSSAFSGCSSLTSITIPDSVTSIGEGAFYYCYGLTSVTIGNGVTSIGDSAFSGCSSLTSITIPDSVTSIGDSAFYNCSSLTSIEVPGGVTSIGNYAFRGCRGLTSITIGSGVESIGDFAFEDCSGLTSITIPDSVTSIGSYAFYDCDGLKTAYYLGTPAQWNNISKAYCRLTNYATVYIDIDTEDIEIEEYTETGVKLKYLPGYVYSTDNMAWQESPEFSNLQKGNTYTFYRKNNVTCSDATLVSKGKNAPLIFEYNKAYQLAPAAPSIQKVSDISVTLSAMTGCQYSIDGKTWQDSNMFTKLSPNTVYTFYQRKAETDLLYPSASSEGITAKTDKSNPGLSIAVQIERTSPGEITVKSVLGYEYSLDGETWQTSNTFTGLEGGKEYTVYQRIKETSTHYASEISEGATVYLKATQTAPISPTVEDFTGTTITLVARKGYEYKCDSGEWQVSNIFTGLSRLTTYTFYQRKAETDTLFPSESSSGTSQMTDKSTQITPVPVDFESLSTKTVVLMELSGYEYSCDGGKTWSDNMVFTGLTTDTVYKFCQRIKETATHHASEMSEIVKVKNGEIVAAVIGDANGDGEIDTADATAILRYIINVGTIIEANSDCNGDGEIDTADATAILRYIIGTYTFPE